MGDSNPDSISGGTRDAVAAEAALLGASRGKADAYLEQQTLLAKLQSQNLIEQNLFEQSHLRWRRFNDRMSGALQLMLVALGLAVVSVLVSAAWDAASDNGLVIESFSVPPDFAVRGLSGQAVASQLLDRLSGFEAQTVSSRASSSYANNWGDDIKVQIPDTGVSVGEFNRFLHSWLGHQTRITGEVWRTATGIAVTVRVGGQTSATFEGNDSDLEKLMQKAAESVYRATQPYRYAVYLMNTARNSEAETVFNALVANGSQQDRAWAYIGLANLYSSAGDFARSLHALAEADRVRPDFVLTYANLSGTESSLQHDEAALAADRKIVALDRAGNAPDVSERSYQINKPASEATLAQDLGDYGGAIAFERNAEQMQDFGGLIANERQNDVFAFAFLHDGAGTRQSLADLPASIDEGAPGRREGLGALASLILGDWRPLLQMRDKLDVLLKKIGPAGANVAARQLGPRIAYALALSGDLRAAHAHIDKTPVDCISCLRLRGRIDAIEKNWPGAGYWFARAVHDAPSVPFAYADWGQMLLAKGDLDGAIAKFEQAHEKGPHFADPLEMWGEALMAQNRSDLALAKFEEAEKYAPKWGRLHLKWGEALSALGREDEARTQYRHAATKLLSASEKIELARDARN